MKQPEPNPLQQELARSPMAGRHLDFDTIAAFVEERLLPRERVEAFAHLATCADCRELLTVATEAAPPSASGSKLFLLPRSTHRPSRVWLRWASIAAGVIVVCSAGLVYKQKLEPKPHTTVASEGTPANPAPDTLRNESAKSAKSPAALDKSASPPVPPELKTQSIAKQPGLQGAPRHEIDSLSMQADMRQQAERTEGSSAAEVLPDRNLARLSAMAPAGSAFASSELPRSMPPAAVAGIARPHWRINRSGQVERSTGNDVWEAVLPNESARMHVVSVFDGDVWVGGESTRLYHSVDNGASWIVVLLPQKGGIEHEIAHIRFQTSKAGTVEAADGTTWSTTDGGTSWY